MLTFLGASGSLAGEEYDEDPRESASSAENLGGVIWRNNEIEVVETGLTFDTPELALPSLQLWVANMHIPLRSLVPPPHTHIQLLHLLQWDAEPNLVGGWRGAGGRIAKEPSKETSNGTLISLTLGGD